MHEFFYDCNECNVQLCRACVLIQAKILHKEMRCVPHKTCLMTQSAPNRRPSWACDGRKMKANDKGCLAGC